MRAKNREINIFNMSLLDILTGMLGAFLFLMVGLVPYYAKVMNSQLITAEEKEKIDELKKLLEKGLKGPLTAEEAEELKKELDRLEAENARLHSENDDLKEENDQLQSQLDQTKKDLDTMTADRDSWKEKVKASLIVMAGWNSEALDFDMFLIQPGNRFYGPKKEKILGKDVDLGIVDSHKPGAKPDSKEAVSTNINYKETWLVAYRIPPGATPADLNGFGGWVAVQDGFTGGYAAIQEGHPTNITKAEPGKIYAWYFVTYSADKGEGLQVTLPTGQNLPPGVLPPPP